MPHTIDEITHDTDIDAAYIRLVSTDDAERVTTVSLQNRRLNLDFDEQNQLVGIESLNATENLPDDLLSQAREL